jgi:ribosomal protein S12 methylthiotransferase
VTLIGGAGPAEQVESSMEVDAIDRPRPDRADSASVTSNLVPTGSYWVETRGCPKNQVDSEKLTGTLVAEGYELASGPDAADLVVVNTCAFVEEARQESIDTVLALDGTRRPGSRLVVTGCLAERYGEELAEALPEADGVHGFGVPVTLGHRPVSDHEHGPVPSFDLLNLPRPPASAPWAYVKVAEGCDRACGFCAIPSFRGPQRSRSIDSILAEVDQLGAVEIVLVAQDLASFGRDQGATIVEPGGRGERSIVPLVDAVAARVARVRLLYLYPSDLTDGLVDAICRTGVPYFDLSLQHVSRPLLRRMRRWGSGERFLDRIEAIRIREPEAAFRSNFIVGYPGETEADHDALLRFVGAADLDWCGFFAFSKEDGTYAADLDGTVPEDLAAERLAELRELQEGITERKRDLQVGTRVEALVDRPGIARSPREAPEIDGVINVPEHLPVGEIRPLRVTASLGIDLVAEELR